MGTEFQATSAFMVLAPRRAKNRMGVSPPPTTLKLRVGCSGFPEARARYYEHFSSVEVQTTFYQPPRIETAERWRSQAPPEFVFTLKAWQLITHPPTSPTYRRLTKPVPPGHHDQYGQFRPTGGVQAAWRVTRQIALALSAEVILFQCPASFQPTSENVENFKAFFRSIHRAEVRLAWEPRGAWPSDLVRSLCHELGLIHCVDPFAGITTTGDPVYYRLHGIGGYRYQDSDDDLRTLLDLCEGREGYAFFNNVTMLQDALRFQAMASGVHPADPGFPPR